MVFFASLTALLMVKAISDADEYYLAAAILAVAGCAMTKFEGIDLCGRLVLRVAAALLAARLVEETHPVEKRRWLPSFVCCHTSGFGSTSPSFIPNPAGGTQGVATPASTLHRFPQTWFLNIFGRFFNSGFFHWQPGNHDHLQWTGKWTGFGGLVNEQLSVLPWLLLILLALAWWKRRGRLALGSLTVVIIGVFTVLALVIACLPRMQGDLAKAIDFSSSNEVGRYSYPFFAAWFLAVAAIWFDDPQSSQPSSPPNTPRASAAPSRGSAFQKTTMTCLLRLFP